MTVNGLRSLVRPLVTIAIVAGLLYGFIMGKITADAFVPIAAGVLSWWFASRENKKE